MATRLPSRSEKKATAFFPVDWSRVKAVVLDAVGTVMRPKPPVADVYYNWGRHFGSRYSREQVAERFAVAFHRHHLTADQDKRLTHELERRRWQHTVRDVFDDVVSNHQPLFAALWRHFGDATNWEPFPDVSGAAKRLDGGRRTVVIGSNFDNRLHAIASAHFPQWPVFCSASLGVAKPHNAFYSTIEAELKLEPGQLLMIGDDLKNDVRAPRARGWQAVLLDRDQEHPQVEESIQSLDELQPDVG